jgi:hypothetical protein
MPAELHFLCRGKPAQVPLPGGRAREEKSRLGMLEFGSHLLHPPGIGRAVHDTDTGRVPPERVAGEGIDNVQFAAHKCGLAGRPIKDPKRTGKTDYRLTEGIF